MEQVNNLSEHKVELLERIMSLEEKHTENVKTKHK